MPDSFMVVIEGIGGTALMTLYVYIVAWLTKKPFKVIRVLGTMLIGETTDTGGLSKSKKAIVSGTVVHYTVGVIFSFVYNVLWVHDIGSPTLYSAILFGAVNGLLALAGWRIYFKLHRKPPLIDLKNYLLVIASGHILFAIGAVILHQFFTSAYNNL
jgi:hypothetical protein